MCIHTGCIIWIVFAPPLFSFALQSVMLSRPVCSWLHYPTAFGVSCLQNLNSEAMPVPRNGLEIFVSTRCGLILLSWRDHCLLWLQWFAKHMIPWILNPNSYLKYLFPFQVKWGNKEVTVFWGANLRSCGKKPKDTNTMISFQIYLRAE